MRSLSTAAALAVMLPLASCQLAQSPLDMMGRMFQAGGRALHVDSGSAGSRPPVAPPDEAGSGASPPPTPALAPAAGGLAMR